MAELDFDQVVRVLEESECLVRATRKLLAQVGVDIPHMGELEADLGERASEVRAYAQMIRDDVERPLLNSKIGGVSP